jgi:threonine/homoserine/homoserine lactone efflux protein
MLSLQTALSFFGVSVLLGLSPGPDNLFVLLQSANHGRRAGMLVVLGLCTGLVGHTAAVALGLAAVFAASSTAFVVVKLLGAAYLAYLAWQAWQSGSAGDPSARVPAISPRRLYGRGIVMNLSNPKVALFFLAFLPQFVDPSQGGVMGQTVQLGLLFMLATLCTFGAISYFAGTLGQRLRRSERAQRFMNRATALVFAGLAVRLMLAER